LVEYCLGVSLLPTAFGLLGGGLLLGRTVGLEEDVDLGPADRTLTLEHLPAIRGLLDRGVLEGLLLLALDTVRGGYL